MWSRHTLCTPKSSNTAQNTLKAGTGYVQSLQHLVIYPQKSTSAVAGEGNTVDNILDVSITSASPNPTTEGGKASPELREKRGWKKDPVETVKGCST